MRPDWWPGALSGSGAEHWWVTGARPSPHAAAEKDISPLRASGGSARQAWPRSSFVLRYDDDGRLPRIVCRRRSSRRFFSTDRSLDRSWMDIEAELPSGPASPVRALGSARPETAVPGGTPDLASEFCVGHADLASGHQSRNARLCRSPPWPGSRSAARRRIPRTLRSPTRSRPRRGAASRTSPARYRADRRTRLPETSDRGPCRASGLMFPLRGGLRAFERLLLLFTGIDSP